MNNLKGIIFTAVLLSTFLKPVEYKNIAPMTKANTYNKLARSIEMSCAISTP